MSRNITTRYMAILISLVLILSIPALLACGNSNDSKGDSNGSNGSLPAVNFESATRDNGTVELSVEVHNFQVVDKLGDEPVELTTNEFAALALLVRHPGQVLDRDQILQELRGIDSDAFNRSVDVTISRLRQKLKDDPKRPALIKTVWGTGYVFIGDRAE